MTGSPAYQPAISENDQTVSVIVSFRERWRFTPLTIKNIIENTKSKFDLILLDSGMPDDIRNALQPYINNNRLEIVDVGQGTKPNDARAAVAPRLNTRYAVFIDNDVAVAPAWLENLIACAEETGAGIVTPLYLWGKEPDSDLIHMAGGQILEKDEGGRVRFLDSHRHVMKRIAEVDADLIRETCAFGEFHCLMMRDEVYLADGVFHPDIVTVNEHIHASLIARAMGFETWFEPAARVTYLAFAPWLANEMGEFRQRWDYNAAEDGLRAFAERWACIDDDTYRAGVRGFLVNHAGHADVLDVRPETGKRRNQTMTRADLQQTISGLEWMALQYGYSINDVRELLQAYKLAMHLMNGLYRPCGRPFINHLAGTASVLIFYGCPVRIIIAGLLHAIFTHGLGAQRKPEIDSNINKAIAKLEQTAKYALNVVGRYMHRYKIFEDIFKEAFILDEISMNDIAIIVIDIANDIDMHLSMEVAACGRQDIISDAHYAYFVQIMQYIGLPGLAETLRETRENQVVLPQISFQPGRPRSFTIS